MPSIMKSPCAKLITRMTPKISVRPTQRRPYVVPVRRPAVSDWRKFSMSCGASTLRPESGCGGREAGEARGIGRALEAHDAVEEPLRARGAEPPLGGGLEAP